MNFDKIFVILIGFLVCHLSLARPSGHESSIERILHRFSDFIKDLNGNNEKNDSESFYHRMLQHESQLNQTQVWLTVSSVVNVTGHGEKDDHLDLVVRALEVHWRRPNPPEEGDFLALYRLNDSRQLRTFPLIDQHSKQQFPRYYKTDIEFDYQNLTDLKIGGRDYCLEYYLVYMNKNGQEEARNCIRMQSKWMEEEFEWIQSKKLEDLMIPGTHDASSYEKYSYDMYENDVLNRFQYTQDESLYNQLAYGIRYLDFRVAVYNETKRKNNRTKEHHQRVHSHRPDESDYFEEFWMVHDMQKNRIKLIPALQQVARFLKQTEKEIVIVDFHRFVHGFDGERDLQAVRRRLQTFVQIVQEQLGQYLIPYSVQGLSTIGELIRQGHRVLIGYQYKNDPRQFPDSPGFWPAVTHIWANTDKLSQLESYIEEHVCRPASEYHNGHRLRSVMAELTPNINGVLFGRYHGLREMATLVNMHFEQWFRNRWWKCANIVAGDFFLGSDLVNIAIDSNRRRFESIGPRSERTQR